jgi:hypothetical protein
VGCTFLANASDEGGAVAAVGGNNGFEVVASNPVLANCVFSGNTATRGAALYAGGASAPELHVSTLSGNTATIAGGGVFGEVAGLIVPASPAIAVRNGILWGNADAGGSGESAQLSVSSGTRDVQRSCVQGWTGALGGAGNHGLDPLFVDADGPDDVDGTQDDQVHVFSGSPCIDAGDAAWLPADVEDLDCDGDVGEALALDVARVARVDDDPFTADTGVAPRLCRTWARSRPRPGRTRATRSRARAASRAWWGRARCWAARRWGSRCTTRRRARPRRWPSASARCSRRSRAASSSRTRTSC